MSACTWPWNWFTEIGLKMMMYRQTDSNCVYFKIDSSVIRETFTILWKLKESWNTQVHIKITKLLQKAFLSIVEASCMWINDLKQRNKLPQRVFLVFSTSERYRIQKYCHSAATALLCMWEHWELRGEEENGDLSESNLVMGFNETQIWFRSLVN